MVNAVSLKSFYIFVNQIPWFPEFCWSTCDYAMLKFILCSVGRQISLYVMDYNRNFRSEQEKVMFKKLLRISVFTKIQMFFTAP